ncbi:uncharacterized protein F5891DRAFT_984539 [Suillus fuscotomentosus]|uniref:Uncharacterized protein n=1 Tax=Suillus fuscotomentosus TaxID=1912939 RepID=A0AAD4DVX2_9AGAM|nr:uncharacterized protein F5891DRAFT_984539 [Suillus fuscotomentosus]KAG1895089.1 hypothetical protein F5891DRAFT_984539 [Suillus fuscotomentosus]
MLEGENGPGGFAENFDGWAQHASCRHTRKKGNRWAQNVGPGGPAYLRIGPAVLHVILKIMTDGPTMDLIPEKANWSSTYADGLGNSDGWAQLPSILTWKQRRMGPSLLYLDSEKATDGPNPPWIK